MDLLKALNWRYATKRMNGMQVPAEKLESILKAIDLAPSSMGLQPYNIIVVSDIHLREKIHESACKQPQMLEGSHVLVFAARTDITQAEIDEYINRIASIRSVSVESLSDLKTSIVSGTKKMTGESYYQWAARQAYLALGVGVVAAAVADVDATPMEGFVPAKMDEVLGLTELGLRSVALLTLGYRDEANDFLVHLKKVRKSIDDLFIRR